MGSPGSRRSIVLSATLTLVCILGSKASQGQVIPAFARSLRAFHRSPLHSRKHHGRSFHRGSHPPCSPLAKGHVVHVWRESDIARRTQHPPTATTTLIFYRSIHLKQGLVLNSNYSCTFFRSARAGRPVRLYYKGWSMPVLSVLGAGNMVFVGISLRGGVTSAAPSCSWDKYKYGQDKAVRCPALYIIESYGIQYTKASVFGRIDVFRSVYCKLDSLSVTMAANSYARNWAYETFGTHGVIRVGQCSAGNKLVKSGIVISNNEVYGAWELITLYQGVAGATVRNNFLHSYLFTAIRCGADVSTVMDCYLNTIAYNYIYSTPGRVLTGDSGGIYTCTHWFNPANLITCNYIIGGDHCYYFDMASSGLHVDGGVCAHNLDGIKFNNGKENKVRSLVMLGIRGPASYVTCVVVTDITCLSQTGKHWETVRRRHFDTLTINKRFPYMKKICNPVPATIDGQPCNPDYSNSASSRSTGFCSGLPYHNDAELVLVDPKPEQEPTGFCDGYPAWEGLNRQVFSNVSYDEASFRGSGDYGLRPDSKIYTHRHHFKSCPRAGVGPQVATIESYLRDWNIPKPGKLTDITDFDWKLD